MRQEYEVLVPCHIDGVERMTGDRLWLYPAQATYLVTGGFVEPIHAISADAGPADAE